LIPRRSAHIGKAIDPSFLAVIKDFGQIYDGGKRYRPFITPFSYIGDGSFIVTLNYDEKQPAKGLFNWLGTNRGCDEWRNPLANNIISLSPSNHQGGNLHDIVRQVDPPPRNGLSMWSRPGQLWSIDFDLRQVELRPTHYTLIGCQATAGYIFNGWILSSSEDGKTWIKLDRRTESLHQYAHNRVAQPSNLLHHYVRKEPSTIGGAEMVTFGIDIPAASLDTFYRYYRLSAISYAGHQSIGFSSIELYGQVQPCS
jgi:hypothetical protein